MVRRGWAVLLAAGAVIASAGAVPASGQEAVSGPELSVPAEALAQSLSCTGYIAGTDREPVLLVPGTATNPDANFSWNYQPAFDAQARPYCTVELPDNATGDVQIAAEHIVHAVRTMADESGGDVDVLGYSQGGMAPRWALKYWPDTRDLVDDLVGLAPSNHGTVDANVLCAPGCAPAIHQQRTDSQFLQALNAGPETFEPVDYTVLFTRTDQVVFPNFDTNGSSSLRTGDADIANIALQQVCPGHAADHLTIGTIDAVGHALAVDALDHDGTADPSRIDRSVCLAPLMPGVDPATFPTEFANFSNTITTTLLFTPGALQVLREPPLMPYARG